MNGISDLVQSAGIRGAEPVGDKNPTPQGMVQIVEKSLVNTAGGNQPDVPTSINAKDAKPVESMQKTVKSEQATGNFGGVRFSNVKDGDKGSGVDMGGGPSVGGSSLADKKPSQG